MESRNTSGYAVQHVNEDSVDIYDDLDVGICSNPEDSPRISPNLKESMDLYEDIVTEEQQGRESVYTELKSRFHAAQTQIKELRKRLEQMEMQNTGLSNENNCLKKNISALLRTARQEVLRKDAEIQRLSQWAERGRHSHQSHISNVRDPNSFSQASTISFKSRMPRPPPSCPPPQPPPPPPLPSPLHNEDHPPKHLPQMSMPESHRRRPTPPLPKSPHKDHPARNPPQPSKRESHTCPAPPPPLPTSPHKQDDPPKHPPQPSKRESYRCTGSSKVSPHNDSKRDVEEADRRTKSEKCREEKYNGQKLSESTDRRHRDSLDSDKNSHLPLKIRSQRSDREEGQRHGSMPSKSKNNQNVDGHHRSDVSKTSSQEILNSTTSTDNGKGSGREQRPDKAKMSTSNCDSSTAHRSREGSNGEHRKIKNNHTHDRYSSSKDKTKCSPDQHTKHHSDFSKERKEGRQKDHKRKDKGHEDETGKKHKKRHRSEASRERERRRPKESEKGKVHVHSEERQEKTPKAVKRSSKEPNMDGKNLVNEDSPNRKLSFMETLNLTLSPNKKPALPIDGSHDNLTPVEKDAGNKSDMDNSQLNIEDMCVIDETDNSELEEGSGDVSELQSPDHLKAPNSKKIHERFVDVANVQEKDKCSSETADKSVRSKATSAHCEPKGTGENEAAVHVTPRSPESCSFKVIDSSERDENKTMLVSQNQETECGALDVTNATDLSNTSGNISEDHTTTELPKQPPLINKDPSAAVTKPAVLDSVETETSKTISLHSNEELADSTHTKEACVEDVAGKPSPRLPPSVPPHISQQQPCPSSTNFTLEKDCCAEQDLPKDTDRVSSTISLDSLPQEGLSLTEAIYVLTETSVDTSDSGVNATEPSSSTGCIGVSKVSSTTEEKTLPKNNCALTDTPKKSFSPEKSQESYVEPSSSVPLLHDEDSMMRMLSNLKKIPDAISPLRSPIRKSKRSLNMQSKPGHVKSLQKDFSTTSVDGSSKKLDVNKENKSPVCAASQDNENVVEKVLELPSSLSDTDLEEGEILSESDEATSSSPVPASKRAKLAQPVINKLSPTSVLKRKSEEKRPSKQTRETPGLSTPSPKNRFKTVCPAASKTSFSSIEEIMETFKLVRAELRKKYMKLHKTFPKKSFYGMMDNFQKSFLEFVDGAHFDQICSRVEELKSNLKKLVASVFSKVLDNGIVKRIFEQQAVDLKQKLWDFVDVQVDYLFKDIHTTLKSLCKPDKAQVEGKKTSGDEKESQHRPAKKPPCKQKELRSPPSSLNRIKSGAMVPYKTGLGSRGKDIRITHREKDRTAHLHSPGRKNAQNIVEILPRRNLPSTPEKNNVSALVVSQSGSVLDKTDFELLTEQQASSLTFNLVRDSQMGEIFKCLLQGSDLLESSAVTGDNTAWPLGTPRKDGERFINITTPSKFDSPSKLLTPAKFDSPSRLVATWSSISPRKMLSPRPKDQIRLNPAVFDESCLLEVPSENTVVLQALSQKTYSILAEDLAVSLTIPSPLKSDSHLSFLHSSSTSMQLMSTPDSVISAHISEDALLDEEDATEQDIHLALDTDNSSCDSRSSVASKTSIAPFLFKPDMPMQALVMEKSNDHFIVKIRQASIDANVTLVADESLSQTLTEDDQLQVGSEVSTGGSVVAFTDAPQKHISPCNALLSERDLGMCQTEAGADAPLISHESVTPLNNPSHRKEDVPRIQQNAEEPVRNPNEAAPSDDGLKNCPDNVTVSSDEGENQTQLKNNEDESPSGVLSESQKSIGSSETAASSNCLFLTPDTTDLNKQNRRSQACMSDSETDEISVSESERNLTISEDTSNSPEKVRDCDNGRKRKKRQEKGKAKKPKKKDESLRETSPSKSDDEESKYSLLALSPSSLSAKNVVRKKGEVVLTWTRDEDRAILIDLKTKGPSRETFSALSERLNKPSGQIAHRFHQLIKLYKKQEKL